MTRSVALPAELCDQRGLGLKPAYIGTKRHHEEVDAYEAILGNCPSDRKAIGGRFEARANYRSALIETIRGNWRKAFAGLRSLAPMKEHRVGTLAHEQTTPDRCGRTTARPPGLLFDDPGRGTLP
jgi:hypothetical protein